MGYFYVDEEGSVMSGKTKRSFCRQVMAVLLCAALLIPNTVSHGEEKTCYKSGIYTYYILNEQQKWISICGIDSTESRISIPSELDGYQVYALGYESYAHDNYEGFRELGGAIQECMEELVIPSSVKQVWAFAFTKCKKLKKVSLPEGITLGYASFSGCDNWKDIILPSNTTCEDSALPSESIHTLQISNSITGEFIFYGVIQKMTLSVKDQTVFSLAVPWVSVTVKQLVSPEDVEKLIFNFGDGKSRVEKLYVNGSDTKVEANRTFERYAVWGHVTFGEIFTVEDAKAISFARKNKIKYHVKSVEDAKKAIGKKKAGGYEHTWKKAKTTVASFRYDKSGKKWKKSTKEVPTVYKVYGKKSKTGKYRLLSTTKTRKVKSKYKYVRVEPVAVWDV